MHTAIVAVTDIEADRAAYPEVTDDDIRDAKEFGGLAMALAGQPPIGTIALVLTHRGPVLECLTPMCQETAAYIRAAER